MTQQKEAAQSRRLVFRFSVDSEGRFTYDPQGDWQYMPEDILRFESTTGPFTVNFVPKVTPPVQDFNPLGGPLNSQPAGNGIHAVETTVSDDLTPARRAAAKVMSMTPENPKGFIARYVYAIAVKDESGRILFKDDTHNGTYTC